MSVKRNRPNSASCDLILGKLLFLFSAQRLVMFERWLDGEERAALLTI